MPFNLELQHFPFRCRPALQTTGIFLLLSLILFFCSACSNTKLPPITVPDQVITLSQSNASTIAIEISDPNNLSEATVGHQYLFPLFPVTSIKLPFLKQDLYNKLYIALTLAGFRVTSDQTAQLRLALQIEKVRLSAYDFIATRKVSASIELGASSVESDGSASPTIHAASRVAEYRRYGFERELALAYSKALEAVAQQVVTDLRLHPGKSPLKLSTNAQIPFFTGSD